MLCVYALFIVIVSSLLMAVIPQLGLSVSILIDTLPATMREIYTWATKMFREFHWSTQLIRQMQGLWDMLVGYITDFSVTALPNMLNFTLSIGTGL